MEGEPPNEGGKKDGRFHCPACHSELKLIYERPELDTVTFACTGSHPWVLDDRQSGRVVVVGPEAMSYTFDKRELVAAGRWP